METSVVCLSVGVVNGYMDCVGPLHEMNWAQSTRRRWLEGEQVRDPVWL